MYCMKKISFLTLFFLIFLFSCSSSQNLLVEDIYLPTNINELDNFIEKEESLIQDIVPNTQKQIVWAKGKGVKTPYSLVYLPGYSATRQEITPIPERVAKSLGMNLFETRFKGNGIKGGKDAYKGLKIQDHLYDAQEALEIGKLLGDKVILMGTSTGAPFGIWLAQRNPEDIEALVFISPNNYPANSFASLLLWPFGKEVFQMVMGSPYYGFEGAESTLSPLMQEALEKEYWSVQQHVDATIAMMQIVDIAGSIKAENLIPPYLMIYSEEDSVVSVKALKGFFERYGKGTLAFKEAVNVVGSPSDSQHAMVGKWSGEMTIEPTVKIIRNFLEKVISQEGEVLYNQEVIYENLVL